MTPAVEDNLFPGVIRIDGCNYALDRVVAEDGAYATPHIELETVRIGEERLELPNRLAFVVEDRPAAADPAWSDLRTTFNERSGFGLDLLLDLAAKAIGVSEAV